MNLLVTISRQLGSGGAFIGQRLAKRLGITYLDREILGQAASLMQEDPEVVARSEEKCSRFLDSFLHGLSLGSPDTGYIPPPFRRIYDRELFRVESEILLKIAEKQSAVIVGRAGSYVLRGQPGLLNVFLHAPMRFRCRRLMQVYGLADHRDAEKMIEESDANRRKFIEKMTTENWTDARNYHLCLDTEASGIFRAVDIIATVAETIRNEPGSPGIDASLAVG